MGTAENRMEQSVIDNYFPGVIKVGMPLAAFSLKNNIIPFRNHFLALVAANYANHIIFGFTLGDTTKDKDYVFKSQVEGVLNYFSTDTQKVLIQGPFVIDLPFKHLTKTELVALYLEKDHPASYLLTNSFSCYEGLHKPCGICRSCLRKYVALELNGIDTSGHWLNNPVDHLLAFLEESVTKNRGFEINDIQKCINLKQP